MKRVRSIWSGVNGQGITTLYFNRADTGAVAATRAFWAAIAGALPNDISIQVQNSGDTVAAPTGDVDGEWSEASVASVAGTDALQFAMPAGVVVNWLTGTFIGGRRLRGKSYIVPIGGSALENNGSITSAALTTLDNAAEALIADVNSTLLVWHRPTTPGGVNGSTGLVTSAQVNDRAAILRSRRD